MAKKQDKTEERIVAVEEALSKTEHFIEQNQKILFIVIGVIIVVVMGFFGFRRFYQAPREQAGLEEMYMAERYFEIDSLDLALNGDGMYPGFLRIIDDYSMTRASNLAKYYAGICYLRLGNYDEAIDYLESFKPKGQVLGPMAKGALGDAYMEKAQVSKAADCYADAAEMNNNDFTTPVFLLKAGWAYELNSEFDKALESYEKIKYEFPSSTEAREIDKYIARAKSRI